MKINYEEAYKCYLDVADSRELSYPLDVFGLVKSYGIKLVKYTQVAKSQNLTMEQLLECMPEYGQLATLGNERRILYNDTLIEGTIRFTLLHELGHYLMGHKDGDNLTDEEIQKNENLANCFARNLIAPLTICNLLGFTTPFEISYYFNTSLDAGRVRLNLKDSDKYHLNKLSNKMDHIPFIRYSEYIPPELPF